LLSPAYRGFPGSTGSPSETGLLTDGLAAFDWLAAKGEDKPILVIGRSLGSGVAVNTAAERDALGLVLLSPYDSVANVAQSRYFYLPARYLIRDPFDSTDRIGRVKEPKLIIHGDADTVIPIRFGQALYDAAPEPKRFIKLQGASH